MGGSLRDALHRGHGWRGHDLRPAAQDGVAEFSDDELNHPDGIIVAGNGEVHEFRVAVGVDEGGHGDADSMGFGDGVPLASRVDQDECGRLLLHCAEALEVLEQLLLLPHEGRDAFFAFSLHAAVLFHGFNFLEALDAASDGREIRERPADPAFTHVEHVAPLGFTLDCSLGLAFCSDEENLLAPGSEFLQESVGENQTLDGFSEVDDVDGLPFAVDVRIHFGIPAPRAMAEVDARFKEFANRDESQ